MKKVAIIDDESDIIELVKSMIGSEYSVVGATNGPDGVKMAEKEKPDFIFLDIMMPDVDGWETLKSLKQNKKTKNIPVAMLTVKSLSSSLHLREIEQVVDYITKPFNKTDLIETLNQVNL